MNGFPISWLAESSLCGSVAIILLLLMRPLVRRWLGARAVHLLWLIALVRLMIPWTPQTRFAVLPAPINHPETSAPAVMRSFVIAEGKIPALPHENAKVSERSSTPIANSIARSAALIWTLGAAGVFGFSLATAVRAARLVRRARDIAPDSPVRRVLASLSMFARGMRILETQELKSPALCGMLRPTILLPPGWADTLSPDELRCVLLHEIGHHRRGDVLWRWAFLAVRAIHWFNPLVWMAEREMRIDQEMACDEWVLAHDGGIESQTYGAALLRACKNLSAARVTSPGHAAMAESSAGLARRIRHIARMRSHGWPALAATAALAAALFVMGPASSGAQRPAPVHDESAGNPAAAPAPTSPPLSTPSPSPEANSKPDVSSGAVPSTIPSSPSAGTKTKETQIEIEAKFVQRSSNTMKELAQSLPGGAASLDAVSILEDSQFQVVFRSLSKAKGVDLLTAPRVTCKSGQKAVMEMIRELRYPTEYDAANDGTGRAVPSGFETRNVGVTLEVLATARAGGMIEMELTPSVVEFAGFVNYAAGRPARQTLEGDALTELMKNPSAKHIIMQPIFNTRKISTSASIHSGQTVIVGGVGDSSGAGDQDSLAKWQENFYKRFRANGMESAKTKSGGSSSRAKKTGVEKSEKYLIILVSARVLNSGAVEAGANAQP